MSIVLSHAPPAIQDRIELGLSLFAERVDVAMTLRIALLKLISDD